MSAGDSEDFLNGVRRFELGLYENAGALFNKVLAVDAAHSEARYFLERARRHLMSNPTAKPTLVWQFDPAGAWERDWIMSLLGDSLAHEHIDNTWSFVADPMIVVDNRLVPEKLPYYVDAFQRGARIILIHLSDEAFRDDRRAYRYCDLVLRNYRTELLAGDAHVRAFPLGCKAGFVRAGAASKPAAQRKYLWSFAGDMKKISRVGMMTAMQELAGGAWHLTEGFNTADCLGTVDYRALLDESVIVPCPGGWSNLETFRVYEALEAGCIPLVERRPGFDYFTGLLGPHPIPTVTQWTEAPGLIRAWQTQDRIEAIRQQCESWWQHYKATLASDIQTAVRAVCA